MSMPDPRSSKTARKLFSFGFHLCENIDTFCGECKVCAPYIIMLDALPYGDRMFTKPLQVRHREPGFVSLKDIEQY